MEEKVAPIRPNKTKNEQVDAKIVAPTRAPQKPAPVSSPPQKPEPVSSTQPQMAPQKPVKPIIPASQKPEEIIFSKPQKPELASSAPQKSQQKSVEQITPSQKEKKSAKTIKAEEKLKSLENAKTEIEKSINTKNTATTQQNAATPFNKPTKISDGKFEKMQGELFNKTNILNETIKNKIIKENLDIYYNVNKREQKVKSWTYVFITLALLASITFVVLTLFFPVGTQIIPRL